MADKSGKFIDEWGRSVARARYSQPHVLLDQKTEEAPECPPDKRGPDYSNNAPNNWLRGMGKGEAEGKPDFDHVGKHPKGK